MPALDLSDADIAVLAMACRAAAHHANRRRLQGPRGEGLVVSAGVFIALAERLEAARASLSQQRLRNLVGLNAAERARLGWGETLPKREPE